MENRFPASIDIGSHSCLLLVTRQEGERLVPAVQRLAVCRLGADLRSGGSISRQRIAELREILLYMRRDLNALGAQLQAVILTEAARRATNSAELLQMVEEVLWVKPRILTGEEEALLGWKAVCAWHGEGQLVIDAGGGSTELSIGHKSLSVPVGALGLHEKFGAIPGPEWKPWIKETLREVDLKVYRKRPTVLVGGSAVAAAMLHLGLDKYDQQILEGSLLAQEDLDRVIQRLTDASREMRAVMPGLEQGRGELIVPTLCWIRALLDKLKPEMVRVSTLGVRYGVLIA